MEKMADIRDERGNPIQLTDDHGNPVQLTDEFGNPMHLTGVATSTVGGTPATGVRHETQPGYGAGGVVHGTTGVGRDTSAGHGGVGHGISGVGRDTLTGHGEGGVLHGGTTTETTHSTPTDYAKRGAAAVVGAGGATVGAAAGVGKAAGGAAAGVGKAAGDMVTGHAPRSHAHDDRKLGAQLEKSKSSSSSSSSEDDEQGGRRKKKKGLKEKIKEKLTGGKHKEEPAHEFKTTISSTTAPGQPHDPEKIRVEHHEHEKKGMMEKIKEKLPGHH